MTDIISTSQPNPTQSAVPQQPVSGQPSSQPPPSQTPSNQPVQAISRNMLFIMIGIAAVLGLILFGINKLVLSPKTQPNNLGELLVTVGPEKIYRSTVEASAKEQYGRTITDKSVLQTKLDKIIEVAILDIESKKLGINVTDADVNNQIVHIQGATRSSSLSTDYAQLIKYNLIKDKIIAKQTKSVNVFVISYWIPKRDDPRIQSYLEKYNQQVLDGANALNYAEIQLASGSSVANVIENIYTSYPSLEKILGFNGNYYNHLREDKLKLNAPTLYTYNKSYDGDPFYDALFSLKPNEVKKVIRPDGTGGSVVKMVSANQEGYRDYNEWLTAKKKADVQIYHAL